MLMSRGHKVGANDFFGNPWYDQDTKLRGTPPEPKTNESRLVESWNQILFVKIIQRERIKSFPSHFLMKRVHKTKWMPIVLVYQQGNENPLLQTVICTDYCSKLIDELVNCTQDGWSSNQETIKPPVTSGTRVVGKHFIFLSSNSSIARSNGSASLREHLSGNIK